MSPCVGVSSRFLEHSVETIALKLSLLILTEVTVAGNLSIPLSSLLYNHTTTP